MYPSNYYFCRNGVIAMAAITNDWLETLDEEFHKPYYRE